MAIENKYFFGGLNSDDEDRVVPNGDYRYALNIRNSKSDSDSQGAIENVKGNTLINFDLGRGFHKCIGAYDFQAENKVYYFLWSDEKNHKILEFDSNTNVIETVLNTGVLNFQKDKLILPSNVTILDGVLRFTDTYNEPYKINIERAKKNLYPPQLTIEHLRAINIPPINPPVVEYRSDQDVKTNNLRNKLFQFRYKYVYVDNEESAWSPISKVPLPLEEVKFRPFSYIENYIENYIEIGFQTGNDLVVAIKIAFREGNTGDFYLIKKIDKKKLGIPSNINNYTFDFYNNETYITIDNDGGKGLRLFDNVPDKANSQSLIAGNRIVYGGITDGKDPVEVDLEFEVKNGTVLRGTNPKVETTQKLNNQSVYYNFYSVGLTGGGTTVPMTGGNHFMSTWGQYNILSLTSGDTINEGVITKTQPYNIQHLWYGDFTVKSPAYWVVVNGNKYHIKRDGIHNTSVYSTNNNKTKIRYVGQDPTGVATWSHITTSMLMNEWIISSPLGQAGIRYLLTITIKYANYAINNYGSKKFTFQYTTVAGDDEVAVANALKNAIQQTTYTSNDKGITIEFPETAVSAWSMGLGTSLPAGQGRIALVIRAEAYTPNDKVTVNSQGTIPALIEFSSTLESLSDWTTRVSKTLKSGSEHSVAIVYYDNANRSGLSNRTEKKMFYVKYPTERNIPTGHAITPNTLDVTIKHLAPKWATHYQFVYTGNQTIEYLPTDSYKGFIQCNIREVANSSITGALQCKLTDIKIYNDSTPEAVGFTYGFTKGDRIRLLTNSSANYFSMSNDGFDYVDVEIISYTLATEVLVFKKPDVPVSSVTLVEIYTPKKKVDSTFYYEIGEVYEITEGGFHKGNTKDQTPTQDAIVSLDDIGDVYLRFRTSPISRQVEDYSFSDHYKSDSWDKGRPNIVNNDIKKTYRPTTIRFSNPFLWETNINGLSTFFDFDFESYDQNYGSIQLLHPEDKSLIVFQQRKTGIIGINQTIVYGDDGEVVSMVRNESKVLSQSIRYYEGEYGIGINPESFAVYANRKYFVDVKRGAVIRLGRDGVTAISEYKMHNYFNDIFIDVDNQEAPYRVFGVYDVRFDEYILFITNEPTLAGESSSPIYEEYTELSHIDSPLMSEYVTKTRIKQDIIPTKLVKEMVAFSESKNRWTTFYKYFPDFLITNRVGMLSFKEGSLYKHNDSNTYNSFYFEIQQTSLIRFISNIEHNQIKFYNNINVRATDVFSMPKATNQFGQETSLDVIDFEEEEGVYKAAFLRDVNTPNVTLPLIEGDEIRCHSLTIELENNSSELVKLFSVAIGLGLSELTNR